MAEKRWFQCLRCENRYQVMDFDPKLTVERSCPKCGSNSVRPEPKARPKAPPKADEGARA